MDTIREEEMKNRGRRNATRSGKPGTTEDATNMRLGIDTL